MGTLIGKTHGQERVSEAAIYLMEGAIHQNGFLLLFTLRRLKLHGPSFPNVSSSNYDNFNIIV